MHVPLRILLTAAALALTCGTAAAIGAIAIDDALGEDPRDTGYGIVTGYDSEAEAGLAAHQQCTSEGNPSCRIVLRFEDCGAVAASRDDYATGEGDTEEAARAEAMDECGSNCVIVASGCE